MLFYKTKIIKLVYSYYLHGLSYEEITFVMRIAHNKELDDKIIDEIIDACNNIF